MTGHSLAHEIERIETACFEDEDIPFIATAHAFFANMTSRVTTED